MCDLLLPFRCGRPSAARPWLPMALGVCAMAIGCAHPVPRVADRGSPRVLGDHPAVIIKRLDAGQGYDYMSKFYPHPAWLYLHAAPPGRPGPVDPGTQAGEDELKRLYLACDHAAMSGLLDFGTAAICSTAYETLKRDVFGGDFLRLHAWSRGHRAAHRSAAPTPIAAE